jgi:septal ring factor EnvC (AmiA/AmiB activator)
MRGSDLIDFLRKQCARTNANIPENTKELREQRTRLAAMQRSLAYIEQEFAELRAAVGGRFDRVYDRLELIERRLDLRDA